MVALYSFIFYKYVYGPPFVTEEWQTLSDITKSEIEDIVTQEEGEQFKYFYTLGVFDVSEDGNLVTTTRVISWFYDEGEFYRYDTFYSDIVDVTVIEPEEFWENTVVTIHHEEPDEDYDLHFSPQGVVDDNAVKFIKAAIR
tara:strand:+ start:2495 stop:2917 length:423 start_codon:yes stop_codon:yes gene_type:complete